MGTAIHLEARHDNMISRVGWMAYAMLCYAVGAGVLFWFLFAISGLAPAGIGSVRTSDLLFAILIDVVLVALFAAQHTIMARNSFKQHIARYINPCAERSTFVLASGLMLGFIVWNWQSIAGMAWQVESGVGRVFLWTFYLFGIGYLLAASFVTNHFELFGLRQAYLHLLDKPYDSLIFKRNWMYSYSRHPMMLGLLLAMWCFPDMSITRLVISILMTSYIFFGVQFEERSLLAEFGEQYAEYRNKVRMLF